MCNMAQEDAWGEEGLEAQGRLVGRLLPDPSASLWCITGILYSPYTTYYIVLSPYTTYHIILSHNILHTILYAILGKAETRA